MLKTSRQKSFAASNTKVSSIPSFNCFD